MYQPDKKGNSLHANPHKSQEDFRVSAYNTLIEAKDNSKAVGAYFNFINAYNLMEKGDSSFGNTCCLAVDLAEKQLKKRIQTKSKKQKKITVVKLSLAHKVNKNKSHPFRNGCYQCFGIRFLRRFINSICFA